MNQKIYNIIKYSLLFLLFFCSIQFVFGSFRGDYVYNYGFSYAFSRGEIPYLDFNMIIPPFGAFLYGIFFVLFGVNNVIFNIIQAILLCIMFHYLFQLYDKKAYILLGLICMCFPFPFVTILFPGYNFLLLLELVLLIYFEKNNQNDYIIGILLGLSILTKQTVGFCFCLVSFYYLFFDRKKIWKRIVGCMIPGILFIIYLLGTNSFYSFFDMCLFGMFDFTHSNGTIYDYNFVLFLLGILYIIYRIYKDKRNINTYYVLAFSMIAVPLFDYYHVSMFLYALVFLGIENIRIRYKDSTLFLNSMIVCLSSIMIWVGFYYGFHPNYTNFDRFYLFTMNEKGEKETKLMNQYIKKHPDDNFIILGCNAYFFKITNDQDITMYDLLNYGNHGYHGTEKVISRIKKEKDPVFVIDMSEYNDHSSERQQINKEVMKYVIDHYAVREKVGEYTILSGELKDE